MSTLERGIVTPEAVVLEFDTAGIASRALARAIDALVQGVLVLVLLLVTVGAMGGEGWLALVLVVIGMAFVVFGYPILCEVLMQGRSPGKAALGLRVVTIEGGPIAPRHAFIRSAIGFVDFLLVPGGLIAVLASLLSARSQRLGDVFAGTLVLRERTARRPASAIWFNPPPGLEGYAHTLDVSAVTERQFGLVRSYLVRLADLAPEARASLSVRLATPLVQAMHHHTPPGVHADQFLQCVASAYQRRHAPPGTATSAWAPAPPPPPPPPPHLRPPPPPPSRPASPPPPPPGPVDDIAERVPSPPSRPIDDGSEWAPPGSDDRPGGGFVAPG